MLEVLNLTSNKQTQVLIRNRQDKTKFTKNYNCDNTNGIKDTPSSAFQDNAHISLLT